MLKVRSRADGGGQMRGQGPSDRALPPRACAHSNEQEAAEVTGAMENTGKGDTEDDKKKVTFVIL